MPDILSYLLQANLSIILFYVGYRWLLRKLTFYDLNRFYLLFGLCFSAAFPLIDLRGWLEVKRELPANIGYLVPDWQPLPANAFDWWSLPVACFWAGVAWFGGKLAIRFASLWSLHRGSRPARWRLFRYRQVFGPVLPFSFWRNIYLNAHNHDEGELHDIFEHEQVHVSEWHTVDALLAELFRVLCWFNPGAWLVRHAIQENLEFITDKRVLQSGVDKQGYQYSLLKVGRYADRDTALGNAFNLDSIKRRIMMMNTNRSSRSQLGNYALAGSAIAICLAVFAIGKANPASERPERPLGGGPVGADSTLRINLSGDGDARQAEGAAATGDRDRQPTLLVVGKRDTTTVKADTVQVRVRKANRRDGAEPLYVVDGVILAHGNINDINPDEIEAIHVWKGKSAADRYGDKGAKGVIEVTTKAKHRQE